MIRRLAPFAFVAALACGVVAQQSAPAPAAALPDSLTDEEFWRLTEDFSEANGYFNSDNLLSNETTFQYVIPRLIATVKPGTAYLGVGPEQNFPYMIATRPAIAFITDIRRGNLQAHLLYKALFEMSADRADFLSLLFSRPRPAGLRADTTVAGLLDAYRNVAPSDAAYQRNFREVKTWLTVRHRFKLHPEDLEGLDYVYASFRDGGPLLSYNSARAQSSRYPTYDELQRETDGEGQTRGYLASEANFQWIKRFEERNLVVPLVGDFAGPRALRSVGAYLKQRRATVGAFYTSNVENYLFQSGSWGQFARNVATQPLDASSTFIRSCFDRCNDIAAPGSRVVTMLDPIAALLRDFNDGRVRSYGQVLTHGR